MSQTDIRSEAALVLVGADDGVTLIPSSTALTRLNYFDGKFLRADDLNREQTYFRSLVQYSNRAGGSGVVYGFDVREGAAGKLELSSGLAVDPQGRVLYLPHDAEVDLRELVEKSTARASSRRPGGPGGGAVPGFAECEADAARPVTPAPAFGADLYLIVAAHAEALCGEEEVLGKLCEDACVTGTNRPSRREGVVIRAVPVDPGRALCDAAWLTRKHRRSQAASAYFAAERALLGRDMSGARLRTDVWCSGAAAETGEAVPLGVVSLSGGALEWIDAWIARRERMETSPRRYWAWQMAMRPWDVFLAQVLQFQCHLNEVLAGTPPGGGGGAEDPCSRQRDLLRETRTLLEEMERRLAAGTGKVRDQADAYRPEYLARVAGLRGEVAAALTEQQVATDTRVLISGGIVELPPAGYLPVDPAGVAVNTQVRRLLGEGVDLRFCVVRPDFVAHALEEAQHMERICLLGGLDDPAKRPEVDVLVPDGEVLEPDEEAAGHLFEATFRLGSEGVRFGGTRDGSTDGDGGDDDVSGLAFRGAARAETLPTGGGAFYFAGVAAVPPERVDLAREEGLLRERETSTAHFDEARDTSTLRSGGSTTSQQGTGEEPAFELPRIPTLGDLLRRAFRRESHARDAASMDAAGAEPLTQRLDLKGPSRTGASTEPEAPSVWAALRCERNPLALAPGESTAFRADLAAAAQKDGERVGAEGTLRGDLWCDHGGGGSTTLKGRAKGWLSLRATDDEEANPPRLLSATVQLDVATLPGGGTSLTLTFRLSQGFEFTVTTSWRGTPVLAGSVATLDMIELMSTLGRRKAGSDPAAVEKAMAEFEKSHPELRAVEFARGDLIETAEVAREESPHHRQAVEALAAIERALEEPGFREAGERLLFPPARPRSADPELRATRDWVLFHRRRRTSCDCCDTAEVVAPPRRYRVYHVKATGRITVAEIRRSLRGTEPAPGLETVGVVPVFEAGGSTLATPRSEVLAAWNELDAGSELFYGAVAGAGSAAADPEAVHAARLDRIAAIVDDVTPGPGAVYDVLDATPAMLSSAGVDGVILLVTRAPAERKLRNAQFVLPISAGATPDWNNPALKCQFDADGAIVGGQLPTALTSMMVKVPFVGIRLATLDPPDPQAGKRLDAIMTALRDAGYKGEPGRTVARCSPEEVKFIQDNNLHVDDLISFEFRTSQ